MKEIEGEIEVYEVKEKGFPSLYEHLYKLMVILWQLSPRKRTQWTDFHKVEKTLDEMIENPNFHIVIALKDWYIVGVGSLYIQPNLTHECRPYAHIENIVVDEPYRGQGVGKAIMKKLIALAKKYDCYKIVLSVNPQNDLAMGCYRAVGFKKSGNVELRMDP